MANEMTTRERVGRMVEHREADRVPITDSPWGATLDRWRREGLPAEGDWAEHLGLDHFVQIGANNGPRFEGRVIEKTDSYVVRYTDWGATIKDWTDHGGVPEFLDFTITDRDSWAKAKARMTPDRSRVNWDWLKKHYPAARKKGAWVTAGFWFGFDVTHSWMIGTERALMAMIEDPEWLIDIFNTELDLDIALFDMMIEEGYEFDAITWPDDMGYKGTQFFSGQMYRDILKPVHARACEWARAHGAKVRLHSCGDVHPLIDDLIEIGIDILNPLEVKAGMDPVKLKGQYGDRLTFHGGLNAVHFADMPKMAEHMREIVPAMKQNGGYILSSDHSVPDSVSLAQFKEFVALGKELGRYE